MCCFGKLCGVVYPAAGIRACVMFGASKITKFCFSSGSASLLFTPPHTYRVSDQACAWFCSSLPCSHAGLKLICHKAWNKARGNFFVRFLILKICWIIGGKVVFYDKSNFPASLQATIFKPAVLCKAPNCRVFSTCALSFLFCCG